MSRGVRALVAALVALGAGIRVAPLFDAGGRIFRMFPTEDGYLMLTIARNLALGLGMTVSEGTIPTNGTQPLSTLLWAGIFALVGGDRRAGVTGILVLEIAISCLTALTIAAIGRRLSRRHARGREAAALLAAVWFASPVALPHAMNCLETGLYGLLVALVVLVFLGPRADDTSAARAWSWRRVLGFGALLGVAFWARNDAAFLVLGVCLAHLLGAGERDGGWRRALRETLAFGALSVVIALPWIVLNQLRFGHPVPISGRAESLGARFGENLARVPAVLVEYLLQVAPIPERWLERVPVVAASSAILVVLIVALWRARRSLDPGERRVLDAGAIYALALCAYYGLFFGAGWFVSRYLYPLSIFLALVWVGTLSRLGLLTDRPALTRLALPASLVLLIGLTALHLRQYRLGGQHPHFQVVTWVEANVPRHAWVGATQSGTLGFFHDRTVNLDGKVNPEALDALERGRIPRYILDKDVDFIADWQGHAAWATEPELAPHFELLVHDVDKNLAALGRRGVRPAPREAR